MRLMGTGKEYKKGDPLRGAAILILSLELLGKGPKGTSDIVNATLADLGVTEKQVLHYIEAHREELTDLLRERGIGE
jgi:hypothetical protein